jgi:histone-lysine N-methyltransferase SETD2
MSGGDNEKKEEQIESHVRSLKLEGGTPLQDDAVIRVKTERTSTPSTPTPDLSPTKRSKSGTQSPVKGESVPQTPNGNMELVVGSDITVTLEPGKAPKLARSSSQKIISRLPPLYNDEPDKYDEATSNFEVIDDCIYAAKWLGSTEHAMDCDCRDEYGMWQSLFIFNSSCLAHTCA